MASGVCFLLGKASLSPRLQISPPSPSFPQNSRRCTCVCMSPKGQASRPLRRPALRVAAPGTCWAGHRAILPGSGASFRGTLLRSQGTQDSSAPEGPEACVWPQQTLSPASSRLRTGACGRHCPGLLEAESAPAPSQCLSREPHGPGHPRPLAACVVCILAGALVPETTNPSSHGSEPPTTQPSQLLFLET